jgi:hypothetical protein
MAEKKVIGRPFKKGVSGNPSGRSKDTHTISQLAKAYTEEAIEKLAEIMRTGKTEQACWLELRQGDIVTARSLPAASIS